MNTIVHAEVERGLVSKVPGGAREKSFPGCCAARSDALLIRGLTLCARWGPGSAEQREGRCAASGTRENAKPQLRHRADHLRDLLDNFADLVFADDQRRRQRQRIAGDAQHQVVVVERAVQAVETALARLLRARREIDATSDSAAAILSAPSSSATRAGRSRPNGKPGRDNKAVPAGLILKAALLGWAAVRRRHQARRMEA